jgi:hypothetical protein
MVPDAGSLANNGRPLNFTGSCAFTRPVLSDLPPNPPVDAVSRMEYFFDTDPGFGAGLPVTVNPASADVSVCDTILCHFVVNYLSGLWQY